MRRNIRTSQKHQLGTTGAAKTTTIGQDPSDAGNARDDDPNGKGRKPQDALTLERDVQKAQRRVQTNVPGLHLQHAKGRKSLWVLRTGIKIATFRSEQRKRHHLLLQSGN